MIEVHSKGGKKLNKKAIILLGLLVMTIFSYSAIVTDFDFYSYIREKSEAYFPEAVQLRRHFHLSPEPCFKENETSKFIADYLKKLGLEVHTGIGGTGIKAILKGKQDHPVVGIRADMDALPIQENTGLEFQSLNKGYMHACGHDAHIANGLIAAKILSQIKEHIPGTIVFVFQPCEEGTPDGSPTGAERMIKEGVLQNPSIQAMVGLHVLPDYPVGTVIFKEGPLMANVASVFITIFGKSSHGAFPHEGIDAIYAAASAINQFQAVISRIKDPKEQAVLTIGKISGGVRQNVIADRVEMEGTVRTFSFETQSLIEKGMECVLKALEISLGISYRFDFNRASQFVKNDPALTRLLQSLFKKLLGDDHVLTTSPLAIGEDFSSYSHRIPSFFFFLGAGNHGKLHNPTFFVEEKILQYGPMLLACSAVEILTHTPQMVFTKTPLLITFVPCISLQDVLLF